MVTCPNCGGDELTKLEDLAGGARRLRCDACGHEWVRGEVLEAPAAASAQTGDALAVKLFVDDDTGYLAFGQRKAGFVINSARGWAPGSFVLHDASCSTITVDADYMRSSPWTGRDYVKACAIRKKDLLAWAGREGNSDVHRCGVCDP